MQVFKSQKKAYFLSYIVIRLLAVKTSWKSYSRGVNNAIPDIDGWKAHILRAAHQDTAKSVVIENLANNQVLIIMDWAMKFLPIGYRETQRDWFEKKGKSWHVSVAVKKGDDGEIEVEFQLRLGAM